MESVKWNHFNPYLFIAATDAGTVHGIDVRYAMRTPSAHISLGGVQTFTAIVKYRL